MKKTRLLRNVLKEEKLVVAPGAYDALSARIIEKCGFRVVYVGGSSCSASFLGKPDVGLLTMTEMVQCARNVASAVSLPVLVDAEDGYGTIRNIQRTIAEFEAAGIAGVFIEDQSHPIVCGQIKERKRIIPADEMAMKIAAAVDAREDSDFVIGARTDADIISIEEEIRRCNLYREAGADFVMPILKTRAELERVVCEVKAPLWLLLGSQDEMTVSEFERMGVTGIVTIPSDAIRVAAKTVMELMIELKNKGTTKAAVAKIGALSGRDFHEFMGLSEIVEREDKYVVRNAGR